MIAIVILGLIVALMFKQTWFLLFKAVMLFFSAFKWFIVLGFTFVIICSPQVYAYTHWTPLSMVFGDKFYKDLNQK